MHRKAAFWIALLLVQMTVWVSHPVSAVEFLARADHLRTGCGHGLHSPAELPRRATEPCAADVLNCGTPRQTLDKLCSAASGEHSRSAGAAPIFGHKIVHVYPHDRSAFTQGLIFQDGFLYESTGLYGESSLRKIDLATGEVLKAYTLPQRYFGEGLTAWENTLIQLTWKSGAGFVYDRESFVTLKEFTYRTEGWGITHDDSSLIMSDGTAALHFIDPVSFREKKTLVVHDQGAPVAGLNELEYIEGEIFANVWFKDSIAVISPHSGRILGWIDLAGLRGLLDPGETVDVLNGIAYDSAQNRIFVTGKLWPRLFQIEVLRNR